MIQTKFPSIIMKFLVDKQQSSGYAPSHIFPQGLRLNTEVYLDVLEKVVEPWTRETIGERPFVLQQDIAACLTSRKSQRWISYHFFYSTSSEVWPPNSPDLKLMDFYVCGAFERDTNRTAYKTREELSTRIKALFAQLSRDQVSKRCSWFRGHTEAIIEARRGFPD